MIITNELEVGKKYKDLKVMCEVLNLEYKDGANCRNALLKQIETKYKLEKQGRGYLILEKYTEFKEIENKRKNNRTGKGKYKTLMDSLLIEYLQDVININEYEHNFSFNELFLQNDELINIPIFSSGYKDLIDSYEEIAMKLDMKDKLLDIYREKSYITVKQCLESALTRLKKQEIINWRKCTKVKYYSGDIFIADEDLELEIKNAEQEVEQETGIEFFKRRNPVINKAFKIKVCKKITSLSSYWKVYDIEILDDEKLAKFEIDNIDEIRKELVGIFGISIRHALVKHKYKFIKEVAIGIPRIEIIFPFKDEIWNVNKLNNMFLFDHNKDDSDITIEKFEEEEIEKEKQKLKKEKEQRKLERELKKKNKNK